MTGIRVVGARNVSCSRDEDGHRNYVVNWLVRTDNPAKGPAFILANWPLAAPGVPYLLSAVEIDLWAFCTPELNISAHPDVKDGDPIQDWIITQSFTTKPTWRCNTNPIENPLMEPWDVNISYRHEQKQATESWESSGSPAVRSLKPLIMRNGERIKGSDVEIKVSHLSVELTKNYAYIDVPLITSLLNKVNDTDMWGTDPRKVLFADVRGERLAYGNCGFYWRMTFTFDINDNTFDPKVAWFGSRVRKSGAPAWPSNEPNDYEIPKNTQTYEELGIYPISISGVAARDPSTQHTQTYQLYDQGNLWLLGIPTDLVVGFSP